MTKNDLISAILKSTGIERSVVALIVDEFLGCIKESLSDGESVFLRGFGTFSIKERAAKNFHAAPGLIIPLEAHNVPYFKPSVEMKEAVADLPIVEKKIRASFKDKFADIEYPSIEFAIKPSDEVFYIKKRGALVAGCYTDGKIKVLKNSLFSIDCSPSYTDTSKRQAFIEQYCSCTDGRYYLNEDHIFDTPSAAASLFCGASTNGWDVFVNNDGKKLKDIHR